MDIQKFYAIAVSIYEYQLKQNLQWDKASDRTPVYGAGFRAIAQ